MKVERDRIRVGREKRRSEMRVKRVGTKGMRLKRVGTNGMRGGKNGN